MITTKTSDYFEAKVRLEKANEEGVLTKFNELYVVDSVNFTECEAKATQYVRQYTQGEFEVLTEVRAKYREIYFSDNTDEDLFYKVKVDFLTTDEVTGKTKHSKVDILVQGNSIESAKRNVDEVLDKGMMDYKIQSVIETPIQDVIE